MNDASTNDKITSSIGERLREARKRKDKSQEELAALLHLQTNIIQALENDQFDQLAAPTYVKGYLRSFARQVDLDGDELIQMYETGAPVSNSPEILPQVSQHTQFSSTDKPVKIMTYLISFGLVLLLIIWWQSEFVIDPAGGTSSTNARNVNGPYPGGFDYTFDVITHPDDPFYRAPDTASTVTDDSGTDMPAGTELPPLLNIGDNVELLATGTGAETETESAPPADSGPLSDSILIMKINQDSWVEVRDVNKAKLYLNLAKSGEVISVNGDTPLSVVLGNADGVSVTWKGNPFDVSPFSNAGVARFKLDD
ncbi:MAG: helix-turn-helix domain-containing protein [Thiotrichales bacterium]|nr:helix-turn-helix domain-containing protein [Thiotrichales bacterium]